MDLFTATTAAASPPPLAERLRPHHLDQVVGQQHLVGPGRILRRLIESDQLTSVIFWGPPGTGKTTLAMVIAQSTKSRFIAFSAVLQGVREVREITAEAKRQRDFHSRRTLLFIDEIHRFNKAQQDALLPWVEHGDIILIGATTENPSFEVNPALLSRSRVFVLEPLTADQIRQVLVRALREDRRLATMGLTVDDTALDLLAELARGDARIALNSLEVAAEATREKTLNRESIAEALQHAPLLYDKGGEEHYNVISAFIKSMRGSDPDAALYWLARMLEAGEDPLFIVRRMVIFASEDVGNADPRALQIALAVQQAVHFIGLPEARINLAQGVTYLASAPKSNASYLGIDQALAEVRRSGPLPVPKHLRNAPTRLMQELGYHRGYQYAHDRVDGVVTQQHLPEALQGERYYSPVDSGYEKQIGERLAWLASRRGEKGAGEG